ncbi:hypothetical protein [Bradyrhizobium embrapense]|uniref:hypothetical protein n=1 Tax=Bradyrhizobium embrapense TaxID=630921 RepID=UPI00067BEDB5|nr:hypothetical protein [Bradyrhizobium embrapense]
MSDHIDDLDASLQAEGEDIVLRRNIGANKDEVPVRAHVRSYRLNAEELTKGIYKEPSVVIISMTQIRAAGWPQHAPPRPAPPFDVDPGIPVIGDVVVIKGKPKTVKASDAIAVNGEIVRVKMMVDG